MRLIKKLWTAAIAALLVAVVQLVLFIIWQSGYAFSVRSLPFLEIAIFLISLCAFIKIICFDLENFKSYLIWGIAFIVLSLIFLSIVNYGYNNRFFHSIEWIIDYAILIVDLIAGLLFGIVYRFVSNLFK